MSKKKRYTTKVSFTHNPLPPPPDNSIGCGLIYLVASFFHNTQYLEIKRETKDHKFSLNYRGLKVGKNYIE